MSGAAFNLLRPLLPAVGAETAHRLTLQALKAGLWRPPSIPRDERLAVEMLGLSFAHPLGLAAGFDKDAEVANAMLGLGFAFVEAGTITPRPQTGNPRPRLFRLGEDRAAINRMGFNNRGHAPALRRLRRRTGIVGVNIGANKDAENRIADYVSGLAAFRDAASYIAVNISSPNTPGLRALQSRRELDELLRRLTDARAAASPPLLLKIAPDLGDDELGDIVDVARGRIDGFIVSNTTLARPPLRSRHAGEAGGLSGAPLFDLSTRILAKVFLLTRGEIPLIGVGGISEAETAWTKIAAGASLLQLYTALAYRGPGLVPEIVAGLSRKLTETGLPKIGDAVGRDAERWAHQGLAGR